MGLCASDLMTTRVATLTPDMTLVEMDTLLVKRGVSGAPVVDRRRLVGVASQADIIRAVWQEHHESFQHGTYYSSPFLMPISALEYMSKDAPQLGNRLVEQRVREVMTQDPLVAHPDDAVEKLAARMVADQIHRLPVVDPDNHELVGIVSTLDLVRAIDLYGLAAT